ncbi:hypothetical protein QUB57_07850 [Microcoleus sp. F6_C1]
MHRTKSVDKFLIAIMTDLLTLTLRGDRPRFSFYLVEAKVAVARLILFEGDRLKPLSAQGF